MYMSFSKFACIRTALASYSVRILRLGHKGAGIGESQVRVETKQGRSPLLESTCKLLPRVLLLGCASVSLAACGMSQITEPLQRGLFGGDKPPEANAEAQQVPATPADIAQGNENGAATGSSSILASASTGCPVMEIAPDARTVTFSAPGGGSDPQSVMHRGEITQVARECGTSATGIAIKYGFQGRVLLGPRGKSGSITLPAQLTVVDRTNVVLQSEKIRIVVDVPSGQTTSAFSQVDEINLPIPAGVSSANYRLIIGFDAAPPSAG